MSRDVKDIEGVIGSQEKTDGALRKGLTEESLVERLDSGERRAREPAWDSDAHRDQQPQEAAAAEGDPCHCSPAGTGAVEEELPSRSCTRKDSPMGRPVQAGRDSGDEYADLSLLHSFSLLQCLPLAETRLKNQKAGNRI